MDKFIRQCTKQDFEDVYRLLKQLWQENNLDKEAMQKAYVNGIESNNQELLCYEYNNKKLIGFCSLTIKNNLWQQGRMAHIDELIVDDMYRRKGVGKKLMTEIILNARFKGCKRVELDTAFHRKKAHKFYEDLGFANRAYLFSKVL